MKKTQRQKLEEGGWKIGRAADLMGLTPAEEALMETKLRLGDVVRALREQGGLSQADLAKKMGSSQPRVAKLENRDPEVTLDLQMRAIFASSPQARREFSALIRKWARDAAA